MLDRRTILRAVIPLLAVLLASCVADPSAPTPPDVPGAATGVFVVNEGVWRQDNATLTLYDPVTGVATQDYFALRNPGLRLGDVANSIAIRDGKAYIAVSTSRTVEILECATGRSIRRVNLGHGNEPRQIAFAGTSAYVTCLGDSVVQFDTATGAILRTFFVGPAPEGIAVSRGRLFVAVSGYGVYRQHEPWARHIRVYSTDDGGMIEAFGTADNPRTMLNDSARGLLYLLFGLPDSLGGVIEMDAGTLKSTNNWFLDDAREIALDARARLVYAITAAGVERIDLGSKAPPTVFVPGSAWPGRIMYSLAVSPAGDLYLATLTSYTLPGEVLIFDSSGVLRGRFPCGVNPGDIGFY